MNDTQELIQRLNDSVEVLTNCTNMLEMAAKLKQLEEENAELTELAHDQEDEITRLNAVCIFYHIDPESQTGCKEQGD